MEGEYYGQSKNQCLGKLYGTGPGFTPILFISVCHYQFYVKIWDKMKSAETKNNIDKTEFEKDDKLGQILRLNQKI